MSERAEPKTRSDRNKLFLQSMVVPQKTQQKTGGERDERRQAERETDHVV